MLAFRATDRAGMNAEARGDFADREEPMRVPCHGVDTLRNRSCGCPSAPSAKPIPHSLGTPASPKCRGWTERLTSPCVALRDHGLLRRSDV